MIFKLNNIEYKVLYTISIGGTGIVLALSSKDNIYPELVCKLYLNKDLKHLTFYDIKNDKSYKLLYKNNIIAQVLGTQQLNNNFSYNYVYDGKKRHSIFKSKIFYYEIGGICTFGELLNLCIYNDFKYYKQVIDIFNIIMKKNEFLIEKLNIIHGDFYHGNVMIKNKYTLYLFNVFNKFNQTKDKKYLNILFNYIFENKNLNKNLNDKTLIKKYNIKTFTPIETDLDINFIDLDFMKNINKFMKFFDKYNKANKDILNIIKLITIILINTDKLKFLFILNNYFISYFQDKGKPNETCIINFNYIKLYVLDYYKKIIHNIINNSVILQQTNNLTLNINIIWSISNFLNMKPQTEQNFDKIINFLYKKQYNDLQYILLLSNLFIEHNIINNYISIPYTDKEIKEIFIFK